VSLALVDATMAFVSELVKWLRASQDAHDRARLENAELATRLAMTGPTTLAMRNLRFVAQNPNAMLVFEHQGATYKGHGTHHGLGAVVYRDDRSPEGFYLDLCHHEGDTIHLTTHYLGAVLNLRVHDGSHRD